MATLSGVNADQTVFMNGIGFDDLAFDTFVSANATSFVYLTPQGHRVAVSGNFVFPGAADEPTGAITSVQINLGNDVDIDYEITGVAGVDVSAIYTSPTTNLPDLLLSDTDTINTVAGVDNYLVADGAFSGADSAGGGDFINVTGDATSSGCSVTSAMLSKRATPTAVKITSLSTATSWPRGSSATATSMRIRTATCSRQTIFSPSARRPEAHG